MTPGWGSGGWGRSPWGAGSTAPPKPPVSDPGWGNGDWGSSPWGAGEEAPPGVIPPVIIPLSPVDGDVAVAPNQPLSIRLTDDVGVLGSSIWVAVNGVDFVKYGAAKNGAGLVSVVNSSNGFDLTITPPVAYGYGTVQEVFVFVADIEGASAQLVYRFNVGVGLRLLQVRNPMENVLLASFNKALALNGDFYSIGNWKVTPVSDDALPLEIVEVTSNPRQPDIGVLRYTGGGSVYLLTVYSLISSGGEPIDPDYNSSEFDLVFGDQPTPEVRLFDSVFGPLGITQQIRTRRTLDDHTADRAIALGLDEQFRLKLQQLDGTIGRTGKPGIRRT